MQGKFRGRQSLRDYTSAGRIDNVKDTTNAGDEDGVLKGTKFFFLDFTEVRSQTPRLLGKSSYQFAPIAGFAPPRLIITTPVRG